MINKPVILGGEKIINDVPQDLFKWPIITKEDEDAVLEVLRRGAMSDVDVTKQFEEDFKKWQGCKYALGFNNGTTSIVAAMWACGVGIGDEIICPSLTYWASALPVYSLGGTVVFADVDPDSLCIAPGDIEHRITERTKAIVVVHYLSHPADMEAIMAIAKKHNIKVIEDFSHAQGGYYKGKKLGSWGHAGATSLMGSKSFAIGEGGMLVTDDRLIFEKAVAYGHYERPYELTDDWLASFKGLPSGGVKNRMHQLSAALGRVQIKYYDERIKEIRKAIDYFWSCLDGIKGLKPHRIDSALGDMAGWYIPYGHYDPEALGNLPVSVMLTAIGREGISCMAGANKPLHNHPLFYETDIYNHGKPTRIANRSWDVVSGDNSLPVSNGLVEKLLSVPYFKKFDKEWIEKYAQCYKRVFAHADEISKLGIESVPVGNWNLSGKGKK